MGASSGIVWRSMSELSWLESIIYVRVQWICGINGFFIELIIVFVGKVYYFPSWDNEVWANTQVRPNSHSRPYSQWIRRICRGRPVCLPLSLKRRTHRFAPTAWANTQVRPYSQWIRRICRGIPVCLPLSPPETQLLRLSRCLFFKQLFKRIKGVNDNRFFKQSG